MWCIAKVKELGIVQIVQPEFLYFCDVTHVAPYHKKIKGMESDSLGNCRTPDVRLVRLMSKWENPTFVRQRYAYFYYFQTFYDIFS